MRADITQPDLIAFLLLVSILYKSARKEMKRASTTATQSKYGSLRRVLTSTCTIFNLSLVGMILGSSILLISLLLSLREAHSGWVLKGVVPLGTMGGAIFESSYCIYSWSRSKSIIRNHGDCVYWGLTVLAAVNPILFCAPLISSILYEVKITDIEFYRIFTVAAVAGLFLLDVGLFLCFLHFLFKNPAPTASSGQFNGNKEAANQWRRTGIISKYGLLSTCLSFVGLGILVGSQLFPSLNAYVNLMHAFAYVTACCLAVVLLAMKMELEGGYSKVFVSSRQSPNHSSQSKGESNWLQSEVKQ
ncbi:hypothetical protein HDU80_006450 [Chytriomyces hyalinus]|nr:hypothetical protein HDU80_006450 [Chytriomyces hyalinus]